MNLQALSLIATNLARVDQLRGVLLANVHDQTLLLEMPDRLACNGAVHLQPLADNRGSDELRLRYLLHHLVVSGLVEHDHVRQLLLHLALAPLLLLRLTAGHSSLHLRLLGLLHHLVGPHGLDYPLLWAPAL